MIWEAETQPHLCMTHFLKKVCLNCCEAVLLSTFIPKILVKIVKIPLVNDDISLKGFPRLDGFRAYRTLPFPKRE